MKSLSALLAISLVATSCAAPMASTMPAVAATPSPEEIEDGVAPTEYHGIPGLFFTFEAWRNVLIRVKLQQKDLEVALATETVGREIAEAEAKRLRESQARTQWAATYGPWLGLGGGLIAAGVLAAIVGGVLR